ncbi:MAG: prepilin peptidase [Methylomonas sp.]|nr:MAG: prepilin peptidase [Methylomonas sp.]PPD26983.1 MAG: prepilin peptidase [Methylomonas sp.]PPD38922.1 MAG: prepilin peptidase [Methylomonas sp.]PPD42594.1 MAG: prepilin peptidase [Methylomonas sp.]PPD54134.1 MAG: prepilin peptidase [Methylomonas sp.]
MNVLLSALQSSPVMLTGAVFLLSLMVGSFLNVVIHRLPVMMQKNWRKDCHDYLQLPGEADSATFNLMLPASHCPHCQTAIKPHHNIPVFSYLLLRGKCAYCAAPIALRYPLVEAFTAVCSAWVAWHFGYGWPMVFGVLLTWCLIVLSAIDIDHQLLPDSITLPLLWLGLFLSLFDIYTDSHASIIGAIAGYLSLWTVYKLFKWLTGKDGMGYGDFKLLALFGAWLGWQYLPMIVVLSSLVGAVTGIAMIVFRRHDVKTPIPFGPYLAAAGWLALLWGSEINRYYLDLTGLW